MMIAWGRTWDMNSDSAYLAPWSWILMLWRVNYKVMVRKGRTHEWGVDTLRICELFAALAWFSVRRDAG